MGRVSLFLRLLYAVHIAVDRWLAVQRMTRLFLGSVVSCSDSSCHSYQSFCLQKKS